MIWTLQPPPQLFHGLVHTCLIPASFPLTAPYLGPLCVHTCTHTHTHTQIYTGVSLPEKSSFSGSLHAFKPNLPSALSLSQAQLLHRVGSLPEYHTSRLTSGCILAERAPTQVEWWRLLLAQCCCSSPCLPPLPPTGTEELWPWRRAWPSHIWSLHSQAKPCNTG